MKVLLVHLSDIHITRDGGHIASRAGAIAAAAASVAPGSPDCFVLVTGDIAFSGHSEEYQHADAFFDRMAAELSSRLPDSRRTLLTIPGNHDCDLSSSHKLREALVEQVNLVDADDSIWSPCLEVQANYRRFAARWAPHAVEPDDLAHPCTTCERPITAGSARFHLLNTAWMSTVHERQGQLVFPATALHPLATPSDGAALVVALLHHPYGWFQAANGRLLRDTLEASCDLVLTGHDHHGSQRLVHGTDGVRTHYIEGEFLQDPDRPGDSLFNVLAIDPEAKLVEVHAFRWSADGRYNHARAPDTIPFLKNAYRLRNDFALSAEFGATLSETGVAFAHPAKQKVELGDLYVHPHLKRVALPDEDDSPPQLLDDLAAAACAKRRLLVIGPPVSGKTALSRMLFGELRSRGLLPVLLAGDDFTSPNERMVERSILRAFTAQYDSPNTDAFLQLHPTNKAIIVDDFHRTALNPRARDAVLARLEQLFHVVVLLAEEAVRFDDLVTHPDEHFRLWDYEQCEIQPLGLAKRADLIEKWYFLGAGPTDDERVLHRRALDAERRVSELIGANYFPPYPVYVLHALQQMELQYPLRIAASTGSYAYVYESFLTLALRSSQVHVSLDAQHNYLSHLARFLFQAHLDTITIDEAVAWHNGYCQAHSVRIEFSPFLSGLCEAGVLIREGSQVRFRYPYMYYYFVARYLRDHMEDGTIRDEVAAMTKRLHHTESANIVVFLGHLCKHRFLLRCVLDAAQSIFSSWSECDLEADTQFLNDLITGVSPLVLDGSDPRENRRTLLARQDALAAASEHHPEAPDEPHQEQPDDADLAEHMQINVAFKTIQILGQILRNFEGSLDGEQKYELALECCSLGLRALKLMTRILEATHQPLAQFLAEHVRDRRADWSEDKIRTRVNEYLFNVGQGFAYLVVKYVSRCIGAQSLSMTLEQLVTRRPTLAQRLIDLGIRLEFYTDFPVLETERLHHDVRGNILVSELLRSLVWYHFYYYPTSYRVRARICRTLDIDLDPSLLYPRSLKLLPTPA